MTQWKFLAAIAWRTTVLFLVLNLAAVPLDLDGLGRWSLYNRIFPGRERFPFGSDPQAAYNLSLYNLDAMFAAHRLAGEAKAADELRVFVVGDSAVWGTLLKPQETLAGQLNDLPAPGCAGKTVKFYNLGYPTLSVTKDVMVLDAAREYQPDLVIWLVTLESLPLKRQLDSPIVANNSARIERLIREYQLPLDGGDARLVQANWLERTLWGRRRDLADLLRLQLYGPIWSATGIDQAYPETYPPVERDFKEGDTQFLDFTPGTLGANHIGFDILAAGLKAAGAPVLLVNEPVMISSGKNSQLRYNFYYPRWAYDSYRQLLADEAQKRQWTYVDFWNLIPEDEFTNSAIHLTPAATRTLAGAVGGVLQGFLCR